MQRLRSGTKYTVWLLIFAFGILWVLADTQFFDAIQMSPQSAGQVNQQEISFQEFNERVQFFTEQHREETGETPDMELRAQYEEEAWEELIMDRILQDKMQTMGIQVSDSELVDMVMGDNPAPFIRQQFQRPDGTIDRDALQQAIASPQNRQIWMLIERQLREQRRQEKLNRYLQTSLRISESEVEREFIRQNTLADFDYVRVPYAQISEQDIEVSDSEVQQYYEQHSEKFKRNARIGFSYVTFSKAPTAEDTSATVQELAQLRDDFREAENHEAFLQQHNSQTDYVDEYLSPNEVRVEHANVFDLETGEVSEPYVHGDKIHMVKKLGEQPAGQSYTRARQIRLDYTGAEREEIETQTRELVQELRGGASFAGLARQYSDDSESAEVGGELGFLAPGDKPQNLSNALFQASEGSIVGPLEHDGSFYIFEVTGRTNQAVYFADLSRLIEADPIATIDQQAQRADDFSFYASEDGFEFEAEREDLEIQQATATEGNPFISGIGESQLILNEIEHMNAGNVTEPVETEDKFYVIRVDERLPEGVRPLEEVRAQVERMVRTEKRREMLKQQVSELRDQHDDLASLAEATGNSVQSAADVAMNENILPGAGREPQVLGAVFGLEPGVVSRPIAGRNAVFVLRVENRTEPDVAEISDAERQIIRQQLQQTRSQAFVEVWQDRLRATADVIDRRHVRDQQQQMPQQGPGQL